MQWSVLIFLAFFYGTTYGSAPLNPIKLIEAKPLELICREKYPLEAVAWYGQNLHLNPCKDRSSIQIDRKGWGSLPTQFFAVINSNRVLASYQIDVAAVSLDLETTIKNSRQVSSSSIWIWGQTPSSPCQNEAGQFSDLIFKIKEKEKRWKSNKISGAFLVELGPDVEAVSVQTLIKPLNPLQITLHGFEPAEPVLAISCSRYFGGTCQQPLKPTQNVKGTAIRLLIEPFKVAQENCPV